MKYASETLELMRAYPGRAFRMGQLVKEVTGRRTLSKAEQEAVRKGVRRVLADLIDIGYVERVGTATNSVSYIWRGLTQSATSHPCLTTRHLGQ